MKKFDELTTLEYEELLNPETTFDFLIGANIISGKTKAELTCPASEGFTEVAPSSILLSPQNLALLITKTKDDLEGRFARLIIVAHACGARMLYRKSESDEYEVRITWPTRNPEKA